jgi:uncharacterized protein
VLGAAGEGAYRCGVNATVSLLQVGAVKGLEQTTTASVTLDHHGVVEDRRFVVATSDRRALYRADLRPLAGAGSTWDAETGTLRIAFADGERVEAPIMLGDEFTAHAYGGRVVSGRAVQGPFAAALSDRLGRAVELWFVASGAGAPGPVTLVSDASLRRISDQLGIAALDARRFRMTLQIAGPAAHDEDTWDGALVAIGNATLRIDGQVPRCVLTTLDPVRLTRDHDVLRGLLAYRTPMPNGEPPFGMYARVVTPGVIRVGDPVRVVSGR